MTIRNVIVSRTTIMAGENERGGTKSENASICRVYIFCLTTIGRLCVRPEMVCTPGTAKQSIAADFRVDHVGIYCRATDIIIIDVRSVIMEKNSFYGSRCSKSKYIFLVCRKRFGHAWCIRLVFDFTARPECFHGSNDNDRSYVCGKSAACQNVNRQRPSIVSSAWWGESFAKDV